MMDKHDKCESMLQTLKELREEKEAQMAEETKTCSACGSNLPATEEYFYKDKRARLGLSSWCRECQRAKQHARDVKKSKSDGGQMISLDFTGHADMFDKIEAAAKDEFRSLDQQVMWIVKGYFAEESA